MHDRLKCEFHLLRYVPDPIRNEFTNIGVILREVVEPGAAKPLIRFTRDWRRVRCLDAEADIELLEEIENELSLKLQAEPGAELMQMLSDSLSLCVQMSDATRYLAESLPAGLEELMRMYVNPPSQTRQPRLSGRAAIVATMRTAFEQQSVWDLMLKGIQASSYTLPGDSLKIDCGYKSNGTMRMFHAVSLASSIEPAKVLAFSAAALREGVLRVEKLDLHLAAVIEPAAQVGATDHHSEIGEMYDFGVKTMESQKIAVLTTSDLANVAKAARLELNV